ncbi:MAG: hypothetical protein Q9219_007672 [cf. Caloplaca sp. 3 TL-2023]
MNIEGASATLFTIAILAAAARTFIRLRPIPKITLDDIILFFACVCLVASTGLLFELIPRAYVLERLTFGQLDSLPFPITRLPGEMIKTTAILHAYTVLSWTVIYTAKFCYLVIFRALIDRLARMVVYWKAVVVTTVLLGAVCMCETFIACPYLDSGSAVVCLQGSGFHRTLAVGVLVKCLDIFTDILLISIPITLLWKVRIHVRQKLGIGAFLCLSVVMIIIAIVKASGIRTPVRSFDLIWETFWHHIEACTAILMVSVTAFRSVFVSSRQNAQKKEKPAMVFLQRKIPTLLRTNKSSGDDTRHLASVTPIDNKSPRVTIGTAFPPTQSKDPWDGNSTTATQPCDVETALHVGTTDSETSGTGTWDSSTELTTPGGLSLLESHSHPGNSSLGNYHHHH